MRPALAISLYISGRKVVLIGDGPGPDERARRLEAAGARIVRVPAADCHADAVSDPLGQALAGALVVIAHTGDRSLDRALAQHARAAGCLAHAHDVPEASDFAMPALARRGHLTVAIATDAIAPALAGRLRAQLQDLLDSAGQVLDRLVDRMARVRAALPPDLPHAERRERLARLAARVRITGRLEVADEDGAGSPSNR